MKDFLLLFFPARNDEIYLEKVFVDIISRWEHITDAC